jgi:GntR family transcriptional repressor for pyruvate dehydrogenase complex
LAAVVRLSDHFGKGPLATPAAIFVPLAFRKHKLCDQVAGKLQEYILEQLKPGDKLPSERELAQMWHVSRSSIRDGIRKLELMGLVEPRQGAGTTVRHFSTEALVTPLASVLLGKRKHILELLDVRKMIEPALAARAARHVTPEQLSDMKDILRRQAEKLRRGELAVAEDSQFHYAIATAADNSVVLQVLDVLMELLRETREQSLQVEGRLEKSFAGHKQILTALERHDPRAAETAMRRHLEAITTLVLKP